MGTQRDCCHKSYLNWEEFLSATLQVLHVFRFNHIQLIQPSKMGVIVLKSGGYSTRSIFIGTSSTHWGSAVMRTVSSSCTHDSTVGITDLFGFQSPPVVPLHAPNRTKNPSLLVFLRNCVEMCVQMFYYSSNQLLVDFLGGSNQIFGAGVAPLMFAGRVCFNAFRGLPSPNVSAEILEVVTFIVVLPAIFSAGLMAVVGLATGLVFTCFKLFFFSPPVH